MVTDDAELARSARTLDVPVRSVSAVDDPGFGAWMREQGVDLLLNVYSLRVLPPAVVSAPLVGSFNLHPGPLPEYAGLNAPSWAIYRGETTHAVTLHWMEEGIDTGPIAFASSFPITAQDTGLSVSLRCVTEGIPLITQLLEASAHWIPAQPQDLDRRHYFGRAAPNDGRLSWESSARELVDLVRASDYRPFRSPWGHPRARHGERELLVLQAARTFLVADAAPGTVGDTDGKAALVAAADEWVRLERVNLDGRSVAAGDVLTSGDRLEDGA